MKFSEHLAVVSDWPKPGVNFLNLQSLLTKPAVFRSACQVMQDLVSDSPTSIVAVESRGFLLAAPLAHALGLPLILARKPGKLPGAVVSITYDTEYSQDTLCIEAGVDPGQHPLIVDDVLATGGTVVAVAQLLRSNFRCESVSCVTLFNLAFLPGRQRLDQANVKFRAVEDIHG
jgi:adenine phosphoribosyltransferase